MSDGVAGGAGDRCNAPLIFVFAPCDIGGDGVRADHHSDLAAAEHILVCITGFVGGIAVGEAVLDHADDELNGFHVLGIIQSPVAVSVGEVAAVVPDVICEACLTFVGGHVNAPGIDGGIISLDSLADRAQLFPGGGNFAAGSFEDVLVVVHCTAGCQIGHCPDNAVNNGLIQEGLIELGIGLIRDVVLCGEQQTLSLIVGKAVDVQNVGCIVVTDAGVDLSGDVSPCDNINNQVDVVIGSLKVGLELLPPCSSLHAVLSHHDVQRDLVTGAGVAGVTGVGAAAGCQSKGHGQCQKQSAEFLHFNFSSSFSFCFSVPFCKMDCIEIITLPPLFVNGKNSIFAFLAKLLFIIFPPPCRKESVFSPFYGIFGIFPSRLSFSSLFFCKLVYYFLQKYLLPDLFPLFGILSKKFHNIQFVLGYCVIFCCFWQQNAPPCLFSSPHFLKASLRSCADVIKTK